MNNDHISFSKMSDLFDDVITNTAEKNAMIKHIDSCPLCSVDYERLKKTINFCYNLREQKFVLDNLSKKTLTAVKFRNRKKLLIKSMPAIAASFLIIFGIGLFTRGNNISDQNNLAVKSNEVKDLNDTEKVIDIIRSHNATIVNVSDLFVEGRVPYSNFNKLKRELGFRKVSYSLVDQAPVHENKNYMWESNLEEVVSDRFDNMDNYSEQLHDSPHNSVKYIKFRVYR